MKRQQLDHGQLLKDLKLVTDRLQGRLNVLQRHLAYHAGKVPAATLASAMLRISASNAKLSGAEEMLRPKPSTMYMHGVGD